VGGSAISGALSRGVRPNVGERLSAVVIGGTIPLTGGVHTFPSNALATRSLPARTCDSTGALEVQLSDFGFSFSAQVETEFDPAERTLSVTAEMDGPVAIRLEFAGEVVAGGAEFRPRAVSARISPVNHLARSEFVAATLDAALAMGGATTITLDGVVFKFGAFDLPLREIAELLRTRETGLRLMTIGKAINATFEFPEFLSGSQIQTIAFIRHAIVDRSFTWPLFRYPLELLADGPTLERLKATPHPARIAVPSQITEELLGHQVRLGLVNTIMEEAVIEDLDDVTAEVDMLDGHQVAAFVRSLAGRATIECQQAPMLRSDAWTENEQAWIALEELLISRLTERYNSLAVSTLAGLTEEEKAELTTPELTFGELVLGDREAGGSEDS
jgi:hypothetical protein